VDIDLTIVIPVFDEEASLPELADRIRSVCEANDLFFEVWMVDDGSRDDSWSVICREHEKDDRFHGLRLRRNYGKSAALALGFEQAAGRYVVTMDADLQDDPAEIPELIALLESGHDLVSGWKRTRRDPLTMKVPSRLFNLVTLSLTGIPLHDFNCGLKAYRLEVVKTVKIYGELHRYIPVLAYWEGFTRITEKEVLHHERKYGRTKFGVDRFVKGFLDLLSVFFLTRFASRPMHFFGMLGTLAFLGGFLISLWISIDKLVFGIPIGDRPLLLFGVVLILVGVQTFTVGLIGEMIVVPRMKDTDKYQISGSTPGHASGQTAGDAPARPHAEREIDARV